MGRRRHVAEDEEEYVDFDDNDDGYYSSSSRGEFLDSFGDEDEDSWDILDDNDYDDDVRIDSAWLENNADDSY